MKRCFCILFLVAVLHPAHLDAAVPSDPRFFGRYCDAAPIPLCKRVRTSFLGIPTGTRTVCATLENVRARLNYLDTPRGGLVNGTGTFTLDSESTGFVISGAIVRRGFLRGPVVVSGLGRDFGAARLSGDGLALTIFAQGEAVTLRKDACGNTPPTVSIAAPTDGVSLVFGRNELFRGNVEDNEDESFAPERMTFTSDRDGLLTGSTHHFPKALTLFTSTLSPGDHVITFSATDSGGLTTSTSLAVSVLNRGPEPPFIVQPRSDDTVIATGDVILEGKGFDFEDGLLRGGSLRWEARVGTGPFNFVGFGQRLTSSFTPGPVTLRLTARDSLGTQSSTERLIQVQPFAGNTPPRVTIEKPNHLESKGEVSAALVSGTIDFVGTVDDTEDPASDLTLVWIAEAINPPGSPDTFATGSTTASVTLQPTQNTRYRITFRVIDSGGMVGKKVIDVLILARPIL